MDEREAARLFADLRESTMAQTESELRQLARTASSHPRPTTQASRRAARWVRGPRLAAVAVAVALLLGSGLGFGLASSLTPTGSARPSFGLGFLPTRGWTVVQSGTFDDDSKASAIAANVPLHPLDGVAGAPRATVASLRANGIVIHATFATRGDPAVDVAFPARELPLELAEGTRVAPGEYRLRAGVGGFNVDTRVYFGARRPLARTLATAEAQLKRLVVASERVTIFARPAVLPWSTPLTLFGSVDNGRAGEVVDIQARQCGSSSQFFYGVAGVQTEDGGAWSTRYFPRGTTTFRAVWNGEASTQVTVRRRVNVGLRRLSARKLRVSAGIGRDFWKKRVLIQRFDRRLGTWKSVKSVVLATQDTATPVVYGDFVPDVPKGTRLRAVMPSSQAGPCYLSGASKPLQT
jgi:hypothetical protein